MTTQNTVVYISILLMLSVGSLAFAGCSDDAETAGGQHVEDENQEENQDEDQDVGGGFGVTEDDADGAGNDGAGDDIGTDENTEPADPDVGTANTGEPDAVGGDDAEIADEDAGTNGSEPEGLYVGSGDVYETGELTVTRQDISDAPVDVLIITPEEDGEYPVVVFQHGFLMANTHYGDLLQHVASHGFVVVAPQMYEAGGLPVGTPSTEEEAEAASELYDWVATDLDAHVDVDVRADLLGLAGHSRGAKVIWWSLGEDERSVDAVAGVDPVDGTGGPLGGEPRVLDNPVEIDAPVLILGTGLGSESAGGGFGQACAPEGENYEEFFAASSAPAWQVVAPDYGHLDMLDDDPTGCGFECGACVDGDSREPMRRLTAGMLVALFRAGLQGDDSALAILADESAAPVTIETDAL